MLRYASSIIQGEDKKAGAAKLKNFNTIENRFLLMTEKAFCGAANHLRLKLI